MYNNTEYRIHTHTNTHTHVHARALARYTWNRNLFRNENLEGLAGDHTEKTVNENGRKCRSIHLLGGPPQPIYLYTRMYKCGVYYIMCTRRVFSPFLACSPAFSGTYSTRAFIAAYTCTCVYILLSIEYIVAVFCSSGTRNAEEVPRSTGSATVNNSFFLNRVPIRFNRAAIAVACPHSVWNSDFSPGVVPPRPLPRLSDAITII